MVIWKYINICEKALNNPTKVYKPSTTDSGYLRWCNGEKGLWVQFSWCALYIRPCDELNLFLIYRIIVFIFNQNNLIILVTSFKNYCCIWWHNQHKKWNQWTKFKSRLKLFSFHYCPGESHEFTLLASDKLAELMRVINCDNRQPF